MTESGIRPVSLVLVLTVVACLSVSGGYSTVAIFSADETASGTFETAAEFDSTVSLLGDDPTSETTLERTPVTSWDGDVILTHDAKDDPEMTVTGEADAVIVSLGDGQLDQATLSVDVERVLSVVGGDDADDLSAAVTNGSDSFDVVDDGNESRLRFDLSALPTTIAITSVDSSDDDGAAANETDETREGETKNETETATETETEADSETKNNDDPEDLGEETEDEPAPEGTAEIGIDAADGEDHEPDGKHSPDTEPVEEEPADELE